MNAQLYLHIAHGRNVLAGAANLAAKANRNARDSAFLYRSLQVAREEIKASLALMQRADAEAVIRANAIAMERELHFGEAELEDYEQRLHANPFRGVEQPSRPQDNPHSAIPNPQFGTPPPIPPLLPRFRPTHRFDPESRRLFAISDAIDSPQKKEAAHV